MLDFFERKLRLKDLEVWEVKVHGQYYTLAIVDERRPAIFEDFEIPDLIFEESDHRANYVSATYFSNEIAKTEHFHILDQFAKMLTDHLALAHCHVILKFHQKDPEKAIEQLIINMYGYSQSEIPLHKLWHFNQE